MKKIGMALASVGTAAGLSFAPALANDLEAHCTDYVTENGGDPSGCACLAETADSSATQELLAVASQADIEGLSDSAKEAIAACFPEA
ncbi:MAG: hypothetical protein AAFW68_09770 [Pseudomonadota bacterium]